MTAIALLNVETDPHIVADTLISAQGKDPKSPRLVWLPALGLVASEYASPEGDWHISRLGRKTFFLPDGAGIMAFAGDCQAAFQFWASLSEKYLMRKSYEPSFRIDNAFVDGTIHQMGAIGGLFSLLGVLVDAIGKRTAYAHNKHVRMQTTNFGTCYISGSGTPLVEETIANIDLALMSNGGWPKSYPISVTEDLAEHISSVMLYRDSDGRNGYTPDSPLSHFTGGFYEWYRIGEAGVHPIAPRVEINVSFDGGDVIITRAYYVEQLQRSKDQGPNSDARDFPICIMNLILDPYKTTATSIDEIGHILTLSEIKGVLAPSTLRSYDAPEEDRLDLSGSVHCEMLGELFANPYSVHRVRVVVIVNDQVNTRRFITLNDDLPDAVLHYENDTLSLWLSARILTR